MYSFSIADDSVPLVWGSDCKTTLSWDRRRVGSALVMTDLLISQECHMGSPLHLSERRLAEGTIHISEQFSSTCLPLSARFLHNVLCLV